MTREEAKRIAMGLRTDFKCESDTMVDFCNTVIKALEQEPCEDVVSRGIKIGDEVYVHGYVDEIRKDIMIIRNEGGYFSGYKSEVVKELPSVTPQQKIGRWVEERNDYGEITHWHCSNCYEDSEFITTCKWDYCPNCGAKMIESQKSEAERDKELENPFNDCRFGG